jgi:3'(2'), 5'-bisphosphate nucleotidase
VSGVQSDPDIEAMVEIARRAGARVAELYAQHLSAGIDVDLKGPGDPVTQADREANTIICDALAERFPYAGIVAEESAPRTPAELTAMIALKERVFFVDPLDGTREFVDQRAEFAVMIGMAVEGRHHAGVVLGPVTGRLVAGRVGQGAFVEEPDGSRSVLRVSTTSRFQDATMVVSRSHRPAIIEPLRKRLGIGRLQPLGSVGQKVAEIVLGQADIYVHNGGGLKLWDTCGPGAVLEAAGGRVSDLFGKPIDYTSSEIRVMNGFVASNGTLHVGLLSAVDWARREAERLDPES